MPRILISKKAISAWLFFANSSASSQSENFATLKDQPEVFASVTVDVGGYGIVWNDELDLSCDELWENSVQVDTPFDGLLAFSDATELWGLNESTLRKAITYGKLVNGVDVCKFGKQWVVSIEAMKREYGNARDRV